MLKDVAVKKYEFLYVFLYIFYVIKICAVCICDNRISYFLLNRLHSIWQKLFYRFKNTS